VKKGGLKREWINDNRTCSCFFFKFQLENIIILCNNNNNNNEKRMQVQKNDTTGGKIKEQGGGKMSLFIISRLYSNLSARVKSGGGRRSQNGFTVWDNVVVTGMERGIKKVGVNLISWLSFHVTADSNERTTRRERERERETHYNIIRSKNKRGRRRKENIRLCRSHVVFFRIFGLVWLNWNSLTGKESFSQVKGLKD